VLGPEIQDAIARNYGVSVAREGDVPPPL
jgi:hypothetical protein